MPRGKELEQLPMSTITAPGAGNDTSPFNRKVLEGFVEPEQPAPAKTIQQNGK